MVAPTIDIAEVSKSYGTVAAVRAVSLALQAGECVALVGHNGAGKSTLIKMLLGLCKPSAGRVTVLGENPRGRQSTRLRERLGFLPENVVFPPSMTGREVLDFYAQLKRQPLARNAALLERIGLGEAARRRVGTYSKGMRQRLGLAQALLGAPRVLLLDEPTSGLDPVSRQGFYEALGELRDAGATVLLSSHALSEIEDRTDRVAVMSQGRLVACDSLAALRGMADLPVRIRVHLAAAIPHPALASVGWTQLDERRLELTCSGAAKLDALRQVTQIGAVADVEIVPPSLDQIYAHLMREAAE